jgi:hypothetical protein
MDTAHGHDDVIQQDYTLDGELCFKGAFFTKSLSHLPL